MARKINRRCWFFDFAEADPLEPKGGYAVYFEDGWYDIQGDNGEGYERRREVVFFRKKDAASYRNVRTSGPTRNRVESRDG